MNEWLTPMATGLRERWRTPSLAAIGLTLRAPPLAGSFGLATGSERRHAQPAVSLHRTAATRPDHGNFECGTPQTDRPRSGHASQRHLAVLSYSERARRRYGGSDPGPGRHVADTRQSSGPLGAMGDRRVSRPHIPPLQP